MGNQIWRPVGFEREQGTGHGERDKYKWNTKEDGFRRTAADRTIAYRADASFIRAGASTGENTGEPVSYRKMRSTFTYAVNIAWRR